MPLFTGLPTRLAFSETRCPLVRGGIKERAGVLIGAPASCATATLIELRIRLGLLYLFARRAL